MTGNRANGHRLPQFADSWLDDEAVARPVVQRLEGVARVLARRLAQAAPVVAA